MKTYEIKANMVSTVNDVYETPKVIYEDSLKVTGYKEARKAAKARALELAKGRCEIYPALNGWKFYTPKEYRGGFSAHYVEDNTFYSIVVDVYAMD